MAEENSPQAEGSVQPGKAIVLSIDEDDTNHLAELCREKLTDDILNSSKSNRSQNCGFLFIIDKSQTVSIHQISKNLPT